MPSLVSLDQGHPDWKLVYISIKPSITPIKNRYINKFKASYNDNVCRPVSVYYISLKPPWDRLLQETVSCDLTTKMKKGWQLKYKTKFGYLASWKKTESGKFHLLLAAFELPSSAMLTTQTIIKISLCFCIYITPR